MKYQLKDWEKKLLNKKILNEENPAICLDKEKLPQFFRLESSQYGRIEANVFDILLEQFGIYIVEFWENDELSICDSTGNFLDELQAIAKCHEIRKTEQDQHHMARAKSSNGFSTFTTNVDATKKNAKIHADIKQLKESPYFERISKEKKIFYINLGCERANEAIINKQTHEIIEMMVETFGFYERLASTLDSLIGEKKIKRFSEVHKLEGELKKPKKAKKEIIKKVRTPEQYIKQSNTVQAKKKKELSELLGFDDPRAAFEEYLKSKSSVETTKVEERNYNS